jgi:putative flavoprotein involved in K+ transport
MPGERYTGSEPDGLMTHLEFIAFLENYVRRHDLPVEEGRPVTALAVDNSGGFIVRVGDETVRAANVVIATGSLCRPLPVGGAPIAAAYRRLRLSQRRRLARRAGAGGRLRPDRRTDRL